MNDIRIFDYRNEVIVELQGTDEHGALDVISYQFSCEDDDRTLFPKGPVDEEHVPVIQEAFEQEDFRWMSSGETVSRTQDEKDI